MELGVKDYGVKRKHYMSGLATNNKDIKFKGDEL